MSINPALTAAVRLAARLDVALPAEFVEEWARLNDVVTNSSAVDAPVSLDEAFAAAIKAGRDPLRDKTVLAARRPPEVLRSLNSTIRRYADRLADRHAVGIVAAFQPAFNAAVSELAAVLAVTGGPAPLDEKGRTAAAIAPNRTISDIAGVWFGFQGAGAAGFTGRAVPRALVLVEPDPDLWWRTGIANTPDVDGWTLAGAGFTLSLAPDLATVRDRQRLVDAAREDVAEAMEQERRAAAVGRPVDPGVAVVRAGR